MSSRIAGLLACGLMLALVAACHQKSSVAEAPTPADSVLVGYGQQSREQAGGAVQSATGEQLGNEKRSRVEELLEGRFPGVEVVRTPSGGLSIRIRGGSTILGNKGPLYVIDGIPVEVDPEHGLDWLNPTDIERIDVLKDAAETSMYGVRGTNGVILITTKRNR